MRFTLAHNAWQKITFFTGVASLLLSVTAVAVFVPKVYAADCGPNAVIYCGFSSSADFISKVRANNDTNGADLQDIFAHFNLARGDYDRFVSTAKNGTVYKDGRVVVDGKTVVNSAKSLGRTTLDGRHDQSMTIGSKTYYYGLTSRVFSTDSFPVKVMFDDQGNVEFVVMPSCGNPVWGDKVSSSVKCKALQAKADTSTVGKYNFTTDASVSGNAEITKYVYDFGDGKTVTKTSGSAVVPYTFAPGTHKVKVTVYATLPGGATIVSNCETTITVEEPDAPVCVSLTGTNQGLKYSFVATAKFATGTTFVGGDFDFGDGKVASSVKPTTANTIVVDHTYDKVGTYSASAVLRFTVGGKTVTASACKAVVQPDKPAVPECKPGIPVGDVRCNPCPYDASFSADDEENCKAAVTGTLPNTGAGNIIALSAAALVGGFLFYRHRVFNRHKAAFAAAEKGISPLPLADPLTPTDPLSNTPLEPAVPTSPVRSTLRRRRQF